MKRKPRLSALQTATRQTSAIVRPPYKCKRAACAGRNLLALSTPLPHSAAGAPPRPTAAREVGCTVQRDPKGLGYAQQASPTRSGPQCPPQGPCLLQKKSANWRCVFFNCNFRLQCNNLLNFQMKEKGEEKK